jgi:hypothetical protein
MDKSVASAYGWGEGKDEGGRMNASREEGQKTLDLGHDFHQTAQGVRFTVSEAARREILSRLLKLNHERYEEEQKAEGGMQNVKKEKKVKKVKSKSAGDGQMGLL